MSSEIPKHRGCRGRRRRGYRRRGVILQLLRRRCRPRRRSRGQSSSKTVHVGGMLEVIINDAFGRVRPDGVCQRATHLMSVITLFLVLLLSNFPMIVHRNERSPGTSKEFQRNHCKQLEFLPSLLKIDQSFQQIRVSRI